MDSDDELQRLVAQLRHASDAETRADPGDEAIPMLTEVVELPRYDAAELPQALADVDWAHLALRVQENVLERLLGRSEALIDDEMQAGLEAVISRATESLAAELRMTLAQLVRDLVARAVTDELTRVHDEIMGERGRG
ncbi:MAG: hypothetical protein LT102_12485 [Burkholderiaceae bacterium]|nr:hypothetical protein [Burkholderiaceae bacterium]